MGVRPSGTVTFLFTDIEGSTRLWQDHPESMRDALARHDTILKDAIHAADGVVVKALGDGVLAAFARPVDAICAAIAAQRALGEESWFETGPLRVRMGVHSGAVEERDGDYFGPVLNRAARLTAVGHGGQVLASNVTAELVRDGLAEDVGLVDLGEVRLRDLARPERVWQLTAPGLDRSFPSLRPSAVEVSLPEPRTSLIGRDDAVRGCVARLGDARLLTLTGVGGCGKTRLAIAVATEAAEQFADGVWFVDLALVADAALVAAAITGGLRMQGVRDPVTDLRVYLARKHVLIVLDNCEHVLDECAALVDEVLAVAPDVRIVATSREPLGVEGEHTYRVASLDPDVDGTRLFEDRAGAVRPEFVLDGATRPVVAELCRRLDGVPLAIELAAAQTAVFAPAQIVAMLDERFTLLTGGRRRGRQATLAAVMDWSYQLLTAREQHALRCAAVLPGSFVPDAFAAVTGSARGEGLVLLRALVSKSLANVEHGDPETRYRLHETVRLYGESKLTDAEATSARDNLVVWVRARLAETEFSPRMEVAVREIDAIRAALIWTQARGDHRALVEITIAATQGWIFALLLDARYWLSVVESLDATLTPAERCAWRARRAFAATAFGESHEILGWANAALEFADDTDAEPALSALLWSIVANNFLDPQTARRDLDRVLTKVDAPNWLRTAFAIWDGLHYLLLEDYAEAERRFTRAAALAIELHEDGLLINSRLGRAAALEMLGDSDAALAQAMIVADDHVTQRRWIDDLETEEMLIRSLASLQRLDEAREHLQRALAAVHGQYAHIPNAAGPAVVAAAAMALAQGDARLALTLARGAQHTAVAYRSEHAWNFATKLVKELRTQLDPDIAADTIAQAKKLTVRELLALAEQIARGDRLS